ncbi:class C sortase [Boudabousia liubingyangii]|uniref:class C sortase n=1 Tax=Boudabousia liubingyangii TaxID=1921764 RepID=UPI0009F83BCB|nr:class C sortase [Boudabousia liubingyangii]
MIQGSPQRTVRQETSLTPAGPLRRFLPALLVFLGALVMLYPVVSTVLNDARQREVAQSYGLEVAQLAPDRLEKSWQEAQQYNAGLDSAPILDPWLSRVTPDSGPYRQYLQQLNLSSVMGRLEIPKIKVDLPIFHGTSTQTLERGVGHLFGTSLPVGGKGTHSVLTGHSALGTATLFDDLPQLQVGDKIHLQVAGKSLVYAVTGTQVVLPHETEALGPQAGKDLITLITCTPFGVNTHRLLVTAERVPAGADQVQALAQQAAEPGGLIGFFKNILSGPLWMKALSVVAGLALIYAFVVVFWPVFAFLRRRRSKKEKVS